MTIVIEWLECALNPPFDAVRELTEVVPRIRAMLFSNSSGKLYLTD